MNDIFFISSLIVLLIILFALSAFFSGSETALMSLDRYKLRHAAKKNKNAKLALKLLKKPDRLIGVILLGNNLVNILITQIASYLGYYLGENIGVAIATGLLTLMLLIFAELMPKTLAVVKSETIAYPAARAFTPLLKMTSPIVWLVNYVANTIIKTMGIDPHSTGEQALDKEELRTIVTESGKIIPSKHQEMLLSVLDLESSTVEDIMIPRQDISSINLADDWNKIERKIARSAFGRLLVYQDNHDHIKGFIHLRKLIPSMKGGKLSRKQFQQATRETIFTLKSTPLTQQLLNFQNECHRIALVVDEYGDVQGLVTLEDILEEIVGQFATNPASITNEVHIRDDKSVWVDGGIHIRELNRITDLKLPLKGPKTMNGLIIEHLETMPMAGLCVLINHYPIEIREVDNNTIQSLIIRPRPSHYDEETDAI
jgi:Mg2+/Co2+ transporter CorB